ncbi:MAG: methyltransferase domain-containing protein [Alphaproteobacteria bacterium]|nr:methyltransferase domain-containing protein [Alphaproteobacteria bacterium]
MLIAEGDLPGALSLLEQTLELAPDWPDLLMLLGETQAKLGQRDDAIESFRRYLSVSHDDRHGAILHLALLGAAPIPDEPLAPYIEALFDDFSDRFERSLLQLLDYRGPALIADAIDHETGGLGAVLDLGCGTGLSGEPLRRHCNWLEGVDLSSGMLEKARAKGIYDALHQADIVDFLAKPVRRYDRIVAGDVLNYMGALDSVMSGIAGALKPTGRAVITVEALEAHGGGGCDGMRLLPTLRFAHSAEYVRAAAAAAGLSTAAQRTEALRREAGQPLSCHVFTLLPGAIPAEPNLGPAIDPKARPSA